MTFNRFSILLAFRLLLIFMNLLILAIIFGRADLFFNQLILGIFLIVQFYEILYFVSRTNRDIAKFILAIKEADLTASFTGGPKDKSFLRLYSSFKEILETIRISHLEKEAQGRYLQIIIDNINIGIISINENDGIELMNKRSRELLQVPYVRSWRLLKNQNTHFFEEVSQLKSEESRLIDIYINQSRRQLTVNITEVKILKESYRVITFKDIKSELDKKEVEAWHKLIRILTHEIMNSVTPMASLTETMKMLLEYPDGKQKSADLIDEETIEDLRFSLQTISSRSEGLLHFVDDYRKMTKVPSPQIEQLNAKELLTRVMRLMKAELEKSKIEVSISIEESLVILGDPKLLEQVLINLLTNAIHAMGETSLPKLNVMCFLNDDGSVVIQIDDNGHGVDEEKMDQIFIPFFSTKDNGSGIGLSLCQQIMNLHGGHIEVLSPQDQGATFKLVFVG